MISLQILWKRVTSCAPFKCKIKIRYSVQFNSSCIILPYLLYYYDCVQFSPNSELHCLPIIPPLSIHPSYASGQMRVLCKCELLPLSQINTQHHPILIHLPQLIFNGYPDSRKPKLSEKTQKKKKLTAVTYKSTYIMQLK